MRRKGPKWTLREHWRALIVWMLALGAIMFVRPWWLYVICLVLWAVAFNVVTTVQVRRAARGHD